MNARRGFTLVEFMILVAIVGLGAAIAIPSFIKAREVGKLMAQGYKQPHINAMIAWRQRNDPERKISYQRVYEIVCEQSDGPKNRALQPKAVADQPSGLVTISGLIDASSSKTESQAPSLPNGATDVVAVGSGWHTFRWDGHKYLAHADRDGVVTSLARIE